MWYSDTTVDVGGEESGVNEKGKKEKVLTDCGVSIRFLEGRGGLEHLTGYQT